MKNVFLSYADKDSKYAGELAKVLKARGFHVWLDDVEIAPGDNWGYAVGRALSNADAMVVLVSPAAVESKAVQREIDFALSERRFKHRLIPVVVRPTKKIPWILQKQHLFEAPSGKRPATFRKVADHLGTFAE